MNSRYIGFIFITMSFIVGCATNGSQNINDSRYDDRYEARQVR